MFRTNVEGSENVGRGRRPGGRRPRGVHVVRLGDRRGTRRGRERGHAAPRHVTSRRYERSKHLAERRVLALAADLGVDVVCVNPSSVQGPGRTDGLRPAARRPRERAGCPFLVETILSLVDVATAPRDTSLAESRGVPVERYLLSGASLTTTRDAVALLRPDLGRPEHVLAHPAARLAPPAGRRSSCRPDPDASRRLPSAREAVRTLLHGHRYDGSKAERELGLAIRPLEETLERTFAWSPSAD